MQLTHMRYYIRKMPDFEGGKFKTLDAKKVSIILYVSIYKIPVFVVIQIYNVPVPPAQLVTIYDALLPPSGEKRCSSDDAYLCNRVKTATQHTWLQYVVSLLSDQNVSAVKAAYVYQINCRITKRLFCLSSSYWLTERTSDTSNWLTVTWVQFFAQFSCPPASAGRLW